ncbi:kappaPI-actitoxin-Avd3b-like [Ahaetulla prasina]|uniref:kappaPI-actitoxin-Avd3b-like n=1 Tax=Ahaetulla prasina TaxID=499056 RepID=UPI00264A230E|nr:kappaPI-actitoxin-Avd3b-like [Ahaetulla prasina]
MRSGRSSLLLLLGVAFALWSPQPSVSGSSKKDCIVPFEKFTFCGMSHEGFFYNVTSKSCEKFLGTSCPRNMDTYSSLKECIQFCSGTGEPSCWAGRSRG